LFCFLDDCFNVKGSSDVLGREIGTGEHGVKVSAGDEGQVCITAECLTAGLLKQHGPYLADFGTGVNEALKGVTGEAIVGLDDSLLSVDPESDAVEPCRVDAKDEQVG
jgi:hypothetical protein